MYSSLVTVFVIFYLKFNNDSEQKEFNIAPFTFSSFYTFREICKSGKLARNSLDCISAQLIFNTATYSFILILFLSPFYSKLLDGIK